VFDEILTVLPLEVEARRKYAEAVMERFKNPFIKHELLSISLNSVSKWKVRVLPSLLDYVQATGQLPPALTFSLAALIRFYDGTPVSERELRGLRNGQPYPIRDNADILRIFAEQWQAVHAGGDLHQLVKVILSNKHFWGRDLTEINGFAGAVEKHLKYLAQGQFKPQL
jgi:tagaturonate reductase